MELELTKFKAPVSILITENKLLPFLSFICIFPRYVQFSEITLTISPSMKSFLSIGAAQNKILNFKNFLLIGNTFEVIK